MSVYLSVGNLDSRSLNLDLLNLDWYTLDTEGMYIELILIFLKSPWENPGVIEHSN